jgi:hypothetical protein
LIVSLEVVSIHFPKAGGSSTAEALRRHFGESLALDYHHDPVNPDHLLSAPAVVRDGIRAVHGHFRADRYIAHRTAFRFTFLREPVSNLISIYYYWRVFASDSATHNRFLAEQPSIIEFARHCWPIRRLMSVSYFGGTEPRSLDFVGFHETRARDLARLSALLGVPFTSASDLHLNPTTNAIDERRALMDNAEVLATLRTLLADDMAFYESARNHWD